MKTNVQKLEIVKQEKAQPTVRRQISIPLKTGDGTFYTFRGLNNSSEHLAIAFGAFRKAPLVRIHSECLTGDVFGSAKCDCGQQLSTAMQMIESQGKGALVYLRQEGRG